MGLFSVIDGTDLLTLAKIDEGPFGLVAVGIAKFGRVDPCQSDARARNVDGVAVNHPGVSAQFKDINDKDFNGSARACCLTLAQTFRKGRLLVMNDGAARAGAKEAWPATPPTTRPGKQGNSGNAKKNKKTFHRPARKKNDAECGVGAGICQLELPRRMA